MINKQQDWNFGKQNANQSFVCQTFHNVFWTNMARVSRVNTLSRIAVNICLSGYSQNLQNLCIFGA